MCEDIFLVLFYCFSEYCVANFNTQFQATPAAALIETF
jgi:hypothetical protein